MLVGAAGGLVLSWLWLRDRVRARDRRRRRSRSPRSACSPPPGCRSSAATCCCPAAIGAILCGAGAFGWRSLPHGDRRRRPWAWFGLADARRCCSSFIPAQVDRIGDLRDALRIQDAIQDDLRALVHVPPGAIGARARRSACPNHRPVPLLALWLDTPPGGGREPAGAARSRAGRTCGRRRRASRATTSSTRATCARRSRRRRPGFNLVAAQPLVARLPALRAGRPHCAASAKRVDRAPCVEVGSRAPVPGRGSGSGNPATPAGDRLRLLPSGPDLVHGSTSYGTRAIDTVLGAATPRASPLGRGFGLARADCEYRAPLPPRLARSTASVPAGGRGGTARRRGDVAARRAGSSREAASCRGGATVGEPTGLSVPPLGAVVVVGVTVVWVVVGGVGVLRLGRRQRRRRGRERRRRLRDRRRVRRLGSSRRRRR